MIKIKLLAALAAGALAFPALAQTGELTPKDTAKLEVGQDKATKEAKPAGKVAKKERKKGAKQKRDKQVTTPAR